MVKRQCDCCSKDQRHVISVYTKKGRDRRSKQNRKKRDELQHIGKHEPFAAAFHRPQSHFFTRSLDTTVCAAFARSDQSEPPTPR